MIKSGTVKSGTAWSTFVPTLYVVSIGYTLKARWLSDLFNRVPKARGE